jgi:hypothetical protein
MKRYFLSALALLLAGFSLAVEANAQDYKIKQAVTLSGQKMTNTTYVKGPRKRTESSGMMGMGVDVADIEQCDLKRSVKISDKKKKYVIEPFSTGDTSTAPSPAPKSQAPSKRGGTVTYISNVTDTGERKQMFGMTARRLKTSMKMESSPDACAQSNMTMESDGWYIDLPAFSCPAEIRYTAPPQVQPGGCQDRIVTRNTGGGKLGFPLMETRTMNAGGQAMTYMTETLEFTTTPLLESLFDIPTGYTAAKDTSELYGAPDFSAMMQAAQADSEASKPAMGTVPSASAQPAPAGAKRSGVIRIGVLAPTNRGEGVSVAGLQSFMAEKLTSGNTEGFVIASEADARAADCDYILATDLSKLKQSTASKIGGMFGKVTGTDTSAARSYEAQVDFKLVKVTDGKSVLQNKASGKIEGDASRAAESVLAMAAAMVLGAAR